MVIEVWQNCELYQMPWTRVKHWGTKLQFLAVAGDVRKAARFEYRISSKIPVVSKVLTLHAFSAQCLHDWQFDILQDFQDDADE